MFTTLLIEPLANGLILFYRLLGGNLGLAIIGFSLFLRVILSPLTKPYMESMTKMKDIAPQLERLKRKHKGDKVKLAQAQADFYRQKGINPGAGCLPYVLQIVILIAFFNVFTRTLSPDGDPTARFNELLYPPLKFSHDSKLNTQFLYLDIARPDVARIPSIPFPIPGPILFLSALVQLVSAKIMAPQSRMEGKAAKETLQKKDDIQVAMQQSMVFTFPLLTLIIGMNFPSGLAIYWLIFSMSQAYQQFKTQGLGSLRPWIEKVGLVKSVNKKVQNPE